MESHTPRRKSSERPRVAVVGSVNVDWVVRVERLPRPGETARALSLKRFPGGKGANQAVAAARLGASVQLFAKVGDDPFGSELLRGLESHGVGISAVEIASGVPTGTALIWVDAQGENAIAVVAGANGHVNPAYVNRVIPRIAESDVVLLQLEIPWETVVHLLQALPKEKPRVILDPAPAEGLPPLETIQKILKRVDVLTPNLTELRHLTKEDDRERALRLLSGWGPQTVCKAGEQGAYFFESGELKHVPAFRVEVVDTTAAGDAFNGALAVALAEGRSLEEAIRFANAAGALAVTLGGAQPSLPDRRAVEALL